MSIFYKSTLGQHFVILYNSRGNTMDYSNLVSKVLNNQHLAAAVENLVNDNLNCLNLVKQEWSSLLENDIMYQDFLSGYNKLWKKPSTTVNYDYEELKGRHFQCIIVGNCKLVTPFNPNKQSVIVSNSEPLAKIARAMCSDVSSISNEHKFNFINCGISGCGDCKYFANSFQKMGYKINRLFQPCIADTKIYDGKGVVNRFYCQFESLFQREFIAILHLDIFVRYSYTDQKTKQKSYRISGNILNFIGFQENKLTLNKKIDVGPLVKLEIETSKNNCKNEESPYDNIENFVESSSLKLLEADDDDIADISQSSRYFSKRKDDSDQDDQIIKKAKLSEENNDFDDLENFTAQSTSLISFDNKEETCEIENVLLI